MTMPLPARAESSVAGRAEDCGWWATLSNSRTKGALCASGAPTRTMNRRRSSSCRSFGLNATRSLKPSPTLIRRRTTAAADGLNAVKPAHVMSPGADRRRDFWAPVFAVLALLILCGCSSTGDFGRLRPDLASDDIHAWVGRDAARDAGAPVSDYNLTDDESTVRD